MARSAEEFARRVLIVGPRFSIKPSDALWSGGRSGLMFYSFANRLANGFTRNGHFVFALDDRESASRCWDCRAAASCRQPSAAARRPRAAPRPHLPPALRPDLARDRAPDPRDAAAEPSRGRLLRQHLRPASAARFRRFLEVADFGFATTGGASLAEFAVSCPVAFIPNPVDLSIDNARAFAVAHKSVDVFCACRRLRRGQSMGLDRRAVRLRPTCGTRSTAATSKTGSTAMPTIG